MMLAEMMDTWRHHILEIFRLLTENDEYDYNLTGAAHAQQKYGVSRLFQVRVGERHGEVLP